MSKDHIEPSRQVIMRFPDTDPNKDPWSGAAIETGRNFDDDTPIDENVGLMPPLGKSSAELQSELTPPINPDNIEIEQEDDPDQQWLQFSLRDVLILTTAACISLGAVRLLPPGIFALVAGGATLLFLLIAREQDISIPRFRAITVGLVTLYLIAMVGAIVQSAWGV